MHVIGQGIPTNLIVSTVIFSLVHFFNCQQAEECARKFSLLWSY